MAIAAILPFHGDEFKVFRPSGGVCRECYAYPVENDFCHTVIAATLRGRPVFVGGARKLRANLFVLLWNSETNSFDAQELDAGVGPSNAFMLNTPQRDILLSANRQLAQAAVYLFDR